MNLDRVTITGADNSTRPSELIELTRKYPFVEWGILVSKNEAGMPRFPRIEWIRDLQTVARSEPMALSMHVCGSWCRGFLVGTNDLPAGLTDGFDRIQLNFHGQRGLQCSPIDMVRALGKLGEKQIIFQVDGADGEGFLQAALADSGNCVPLFDMSHGAGVLPTTWPKAEYMENDQSLAYHGYAGGLGPDNLPSQIPVIARAAGKARFWIDMETKVRSSADRIFDLKKVEACLEHAAPFVQGVA